MLTGLPLPRRATPQVCVAAWHAVERAYWAAQCAQPSARLRFDRPEAADAAPLEATTAGLEVVLEADTTHLLRQGSDLRRGIQPQHLLVASLGHALGQWLEVDVIRIDLERDGRATLPGACGSDAAEAGRTVGWLTARHPLVLDDLRADLATLVDRTRAHLDDVPHRGLGYGMLRLRALRDIVGCCSAGRRTGVDWPGAVRPVRDVTAPARGASGSPPSWAA